jgi:hypothetical protein
MAEEAATQDQGALRRDTRGSVVNSLEQAFSAEFAKFGIEPNFASPLAAYALERLERLIDGAPGPWCYQTAGGRGRKHPIQKIKVQIGRLGAAFNECHHFADTHAKTDEVNACQNFLDRISDYTGLQPGELIQLLELAADSSLNLGQPRAESAPVKLRRDAFVLNLFLLVRAHKQSFKIDADDGFLELLFSCQRLLPKADRESREELRDRIAAVRGRNIRMFELYEQSGISRPKLEA